jgi:hypothetical protein
MRSRSSTCTPFAACVPFVLGSLLAAPAAAQAKSAELARARQLLDGRGEREVIEGAQLCAQTNTPAAVELLLEVIERTERRTHLHLSPGHYRDIVWDALTKITDIYARRRVEHEAKTAKDPRVRQWCVELLGIYGNADFGDTLRQALKSPDDGIKQWAARSLGTMQFTPAAPQLQALARDSNDYVRANAIEALARIDAAHVLPFRAAITQDKSGGVRCALLGAAPEVCADAAEELSAAALRDPDWRPRMQAVQNLGQIKTKSAVDALLEALRDVWVKWWADNRATFGFPEKRGVAKRDVGTVAYNGVPVDSDHVAFLLDKSVQMQARLAAKGKSKEEAAVEELDQVLQKLADKITFNVFNYEEEVRSLTKAASKLTEKARDRALAFAREKSAGKEKDIWAALSMVVADPTLDTAYLLSSGEPDTGLYVHWNRVTRHLADLNRFHKVTVHTVVYSDNQWFREQLEKIAQTTGGSFQWFE